MMKNTLLPFENFKAELKNLETSQLLRLVKEKYISKIKVKAAEHELANRPEQTQIARQNRKVALAAIRNRIEEFKQTKKEFQKAVETDSKPTVQADDRAKHEARVKAKIADDVAQWRAEVEAKDAAYLADREKKKLRTATPPPPPIPAVHQPPGRAC